MGFKVLTWDLLFPEQLLTQVETGLLHDWLLANITTNEWMGFDKIIQSVKNIIGKRHNLVYYNLLFYYKYEGRYYFYLKHEKGSNEWFFQRKLKEKEEFAKWGSGEI